MSEWVLFLMAGGPAPGGAGQSGNPLTMMAPMLLIFGIFYFMLIRPQQRKEKERKAMIAELKTGARVIFGGGIVGMVTNVKESTFTVKVAEGVKIEILRGAVVRVVDKGEKLGDDVSA